MQIVHTWGFCLRLVFSLRMKGSAVGYVGVIGYMAVISCPLRRFGHPAAIAFRNTKHSLYIYVNNEEKEEEEEEEEEENDHDAYDLAWMLISTMGHIYTDVRMLVIRGFCLSHFCFFLPRVSASYSREKDQTIV